MENWLVWLLIAGALVGLELTSGTFYLLMLACGPLAAALLAWSGQGLSVQLVIAGLGSAAAFLGLRYLRDSRHEPPARGNPDLNFDIGQTLEIDAWSTPRHTRTRYRGADWDVELDASIAGVAQPGLYSIVALHGSKLIVVPLTASPMEGER